MKLPARPGAAVLLAVFLVLAHSCPAWSSFTGPVQRFAVPGGAFEIPDARAGARVLELRARNGMTRLAVSCSVSGGVLTVTVPPGSPPGYYDAVSADGEALARVRILREGGEWIRIAHLTDIHYREDPVLEDSLEKALGLLADFDPDLVLCSGDIMTHPDEAGFEAVSRILDLAPAPVFCAPGNHDHEEISLFVSRFSPGTWFSFDAGRFHFVALDTGPAADSFSRRGRGLGSGQMTWLRQDLVQAGDRPVVVFLHHSPVVRQNGFPESPEVLQLLAENGVVAILAGHLHRDAVFDAKGHPTDRVSGTGPLVIHTTTLGSSRLKGAYRGIRFLDLTLGGIHRSTRPGSVPLDSRPGAASGGSEAPVDRGAP